jgi:parvulin-like peptidyl-prolyl isomerase
MRGCTDSIGTVAAVLITVSMVVGTCITLGWAAGPVVARTDTFELNASDLEQWSTFLSGRKDFRRQLRQAEDERIEIVRAAALTRIVLADYGELARAEEKQSLRRDTEDQAARRTYLREVLGPQIVVEESEARKIFSTYGEGFRKARGVRAREIFLWAPADLEELRASQLARLKKIRETATTVEVFEEAAREYSDATSAYRGGSIGTVLEDRVQGNLRDVLFGVSQGLTEIAESQHGLYLFYVTRTSPAKENIFEDVAEGIYSRLRRQKLESLITYDAASLRDQHGFAVLGGDAQSTGDRPVLRIDGREYTARELDLEVVQPNRIESRGMAMLYRNELRRRGIAPDPSGEDLAYQWELSRRILRRLVSHQLAAEDRHDTPVYNVRDPEVAVERWTFDLLTVDHATDPEIFFAVFRALHALPGDASLDDLRRRLERRYGLEANIRSFDNVLAPSAAGLGPEIHTTIKRRLAVGERSKPLHLGDRNQVVVIALHGKTVDIEATRARINRARDRQTSLEVLERLEKELLRRHRFTENL